VKPGGTSVVGSTGRLATSAVITPPSTRSPFSSSGYQTGIGTPKKRWRLMSQSPVRPLVQFS
jgi:hypothetical protein